MAFTRFNYDKCRTLKTLQQSSDPGRYMLNVPGNGGEPCYMENPHIRMQKWGANLMKVNGGHPIDIDSDLRGITRRIVGSGKHMYPNKGVVKSEPIKYQENKGTMQRQTRVTHPAREYRHLEQTLVFPLLLNPQENVCFHFENNLNTRLLERDSYVPKLPCL